MSNKKFESTTIKKQRLRLLANLSLFYPDPVQLGSLWRTVCGDPLYTKLLFQKDVYYLHEKQHIKFIDDAIGGMEEFFDKVCILTSTGKEIAEGTMTDPALEI